MLPGFSAVQGRPNADEGGTFFDGDAVILARPHRELAELEALGELAQPPEVRSRVLGIVRERRHRRESSDVGRATLEEGLDLCLRHAGLRLLAREVDLDESGDLEPPGGRVRVQRMHELADLADRLRLPALEMADEVPAEGVPVLGVLRLEVLRAVLTDYVDAGLAQRRHVLDR